MVSEVPFTQRAKSKVEVEVYDEHGSWGVFAIDSDYPIAICGSQEDADYIAWLWNQEREEGT